MNGPILIRELEPSDSECVRTFLITHFGSTRVVSRGVMHQANELPGFIALHDGVPRALLTYSHRGNELEVVTLHAATPGLGLGSRLLEAARKRACDLRCRRMCFITTNDNHPAMQFYQRRGMRIAAIHRGAIAESRKLKPEISFFGVGGHPIEDEVEFRVAVDGLLTRNRFADSAGPCFFPIPGVWSATLPLATGQILGRFVLDPQATRQKENLSLAVLEIKNLSMCACDFALLSRKGGTLKSYRAFRPGDSNIEDENKKRAFPPGRSVCNRCDAGW
jgi:ribosomal protein S18 acetylase RimI-like enzyme